METEFSEYQTNRVGVRHKHRNNQDRPQRSMEKVRYAFVQKYQKRTCIYRKVGDIGDFDTSVV